MSASEQLMRLIRRFEGCRLYAYRCPAGVLTCGWGSTGPDVTASTVWTQEQADSRMSRDADVFLSAASRLCPKADGSDLAALADFAYNLGAARLAGSTLRRRYNSGDFSGARRELGRWVCAAGVRLPGLVSRRAAEASLIGADRGL